MKLASIVIGIMLIQNFEQLTLIDALGYFLITWGHYKNES